MADTDLITAITELSFEGPPSARSRYDIEVDGKRILVKTKLYGDEEKYAVSNGFLWSDVLVDEPHVIPFDFLVLVGIQNKQPQLYILTEKEFRKHSKPIGWGHRRGGRVIGLVEGVNEAEFDALHNRRREHVEEWRGTEIRELFKHSEENWNKMRKSEIPKT